MFTDIYKKIRSELEKSKNVLIISHKSPDPDTIGGAVALSNVINSFGVQTTLACIDPVPDNFNFLINSGDFVTEFVLKEFDFVIIVDAGAYHMTGFHTVYPSLFSKDVRIINIDHHASNENFGCINLVDIASPSVTCVLFDMFMSWEVPISTDIATALLAGVYSDTGCFMHANSTKQAFGIASSLMDLGANLSLIVKNLFRNNSVSSLRLWGRVLENSRISNGNVVVSVIKQSDFDKSGAQLEDLSGVVDYLGMVPKTKFSVLLNEDANGNVKGSLRSRCIDLDLSRIAGVFGGGGHRGASGFIVPGNINL